MVQLSGGDVSESKFYSFFNAPMFVGLTSKILESDSARSPTSPLDFRVFSNLGNPFWLPRSSNERHRNTWFKSKVVGLGIIDSPDFETEHSRKVIRASDSKNIIFGIKTLNSQTSIDAQAPKSLPNDVVITRGTHNSNKNSFGESFDLGDNTNELESSVNVRSFSFDSERSRSRSRSDFDKGTSFLGCKGFVSENGSKTWDSSNGKHNKPIIESIGSCNRLINNIPPEEIELSEDYTCVKVHGPNPKVTHIFGDCILTLTSFEKNKEDDDMAVIPRASGVSIAPPSLPISDFLKHCYKCNKNLDGEDIYIYKGEKSFCSSNCRLQEILIDEEMEKKSKNDNINNNNNKNDESSESRWFIST